MVKRFFKLIYVLCLIAIGLSLPFYLLTSIKPNEVVRTTYKAKCLSNNQYVVLEGSSPNQVYIFDEFTLNSPLFPADDLTKTLNFYCKYYDDIQPYILRYAESKTPEEVIDTNKDYFNFQNRMMKYVDSYPPLYQLEIVEEMFQPYTIYGPIVDWLIGAVSAFLLLQILRICYIYTVFGEIVWHPFKHKTKILK